MDLSWMEEIPLLKKIKAFFYLRKRIGDILHIFPVSFFMPKRPVRRPGISVFMCVKNEAQWIEATLRSLAPFVEHFSIVDNGSTDATIAIIRRIAAELKLDFILEEMPDADFADVQDRALRNTVCEWIVLWAGDIICRTQGEHTFHIIRDYALSLNNKRHYAISFPHIQLDGDLCHQNPERPIHYELYMMTYSDALYHARTGRFREMRFPLYYKRIYLWETVSFHMWGLDMPFDMIRRRYWEEYRTIPADKREKDYMAFITSCIRRDYGTESVEDASALYCRERFSTLVPYNAEKYGEFPTLLTPFLDTFPLRLVYREGRIVGRTDIMDTLTRLDAAKRKTRVDVIISTRGRREMPVETVKYLLEQDYPAFRVIVVDQNDEPLSALDELGKRHDNLVHHITPTRGLPAGRNEGISLSDAEIVIFVDDDIVPEPGFIEGHVMAYCHATVGGTAGMVKEARPEMNIPVSREKIGKLNYWRGEIYRGFTYDRPLDIDSAQGVSMSFRRSVLLETGGFDSGYGGTFFFEETDICLRVRKKGYTIRYTPDARLTHLGAPTGGCRVKDEARLAYWYGHNFMLLFLKHFPRRAFPIWFSVRIAKFLHDVVRTRSLKPFFAGFRGMMAAWGYYRRTS